MDLRVRRGALAIAVTFPSVKPVDLLAGLGFFSVAVGFAFQDILDNTLSGILLLFRQPFRSGDQITVVERSGTVQGITICETKLITYDGELVVIPNRDVYKNVINVHTHNDIHRMEFAVGIAYENDPDDAIEVIHEVLSTLDKVRREPEPLAIVIELGVSTVKVSVMFWTDAHRASIRSPRATWRSAPSSGRSIGWASRCPPTSSPSRPRRASEPPSTASCRSSRAAA